MADEIEKLALGKFAADIPTAQGPGHRIIYVNSSRMGVSPWDVRMIVGHVVEVGGGQLNQDEATLVMSPQHAKQFHKSLTKTLSSYEEIFGPISDLSAVLERAVIERAKGAAPGPKPKLKRLKP